MRGANWWGDAIRGNAVWVVFVKEVIDNLRDRRSLLLGLVYPLLGPVLLSVMVSLASGVIEAGPEERVRLAIQGGQHAPALVAYLKDQGISVLPTPVDGEAAVRDGRLDTMNPGAGRLRRPLPRRPPGDHPGLHPSGAPARHDRRQPPVFPARRIQPRGRPAPPGETGDRPAGRRAGDRRERQRRRRRRRHRHLPVHGAAVLHLHGLHGRRLPGPRHHVGRARARLPRAPARQPGAALGPDVRQVPGRRRLHRHRPDRPARRLQGDVRHGPATPAPTSPASSISRPCWRCSSSPCP